MKKSILSIIVFICTMTGLFSQNFMMKEYFDLDTEFQGKAGSYYLEPYSEYTYTRFLALGEPVKKYTKVNEWLLEEALNEWELLEGEYYLIICSNTVITRYDEAVGFLVKITSKKGSYEIMGAVVTTMGTFIDAQDSLTPTPEQIELDKDLGFER